MSQIIYKGLTKSELDAAYNNTMAVSNFPELLSNFQKKSSQTYQSNRCIRNLPYGKKDRERYDFIACGHSAAATYVFIHGGYWSHCTKEDFAFIADGFIKNNINVILAEYTLTPEASMTEIVKEVSQLLDHLAGDRDGLGIAGKPLYLGGHSAGGHLALMHRSHPAVSLVHAISALVDLEPMNLCWLKETLQLTAKEINDYSPIKHISKGAPTLITVGAKELSGLRYQSTDYALACEAAGEQIGLIHVPGCTHFSVLEDLSNPDGWQLNSLLKLA